MSFFSFYKIREQEDGTGLTWSGVGTNGNGEEMGKGYRRVNLVQIMCTHVYKQNNGT
jgi:hypothetical protein